MEMISPKQISVFITYQALIQQPFINRHYTSDTVRGKNKIRMKSSLTSRSLYSTEMK